jgi:nucleotide-binding universal stress UspA family protein
MTQDNDRIVVGVDGSPAAADALTWAVRQGRLTGATVEAVAAWEYPAMYAGGFGSGYALPTDVDWAGEARKSLDQAVTAALSDEDLAVVEQRVVEGHPARVLLDAAAGATLLVVGSRGHGGFAGLLLGSVSEYLVAHAPCPVVVVRHT